MYCIGVTETRCFEVAQVQYQHCCSFANVLVIMPTHVMITAATYDDGGGGDDDDWDDLSSGLGVQN